MKIFSSVLLFFLSFSALAAMDLPPELNTPAEVTAFANRVKTLVPETMTTGHRIEQLGQLPGAGQGVEAYVRLEQELLRKLKADPRYMELAAKRPALQTLVFKKVLETKSVGRGVTPEWNALRLENVTPPELGLRAALEAAASRSSTQIFSGLSRVLPPEGKQQLGQPDLLLRWRAIQPLLEALPIAELRAGFDISRFGIANAEWVIKDLDDLVHEVSDVESHLAVQLQKSYEAQHGLNAEAWFALEDGTEKVLEPLFTEGANPKVKTFVETLDRRMAKLYMSDTATISTEVVERELILRELPPYLAIYRGCVGTDCSTSHAWAFPYSPMERDWWIETADGKRLGYVSGNITKLNDRPSLYIRDIHGPGVTVEDIDTILSGFYLARSFYGADQMTIQAVAFTGENHFVNLQAKLTNFPTVREVNQVFEDNWLRTTYLGNLQGSSLSYDGVNRHTLVRQVELTPQQLRPYRAHSLDGKTPHADEPGDVWAQLELAVSSGDAGLMQSAPPAQDGNWADLIADLRNTHRLSVADYQRAVEAAFVRNELKFSRNLQRRYENLFLLGFLAAPDAFESEANQRQSVRYVIEMIWRTPRPELAVPYLRDHVEVFENSDVMTRQVTSLFERMQPADIPRLAALWDGGYRFRHVELTAAQSSWMTQSLNRPAATLEYFRRATTAPPGSEQIAAAYLHLEQLAVLLQNEGDDESVAAGAAEVLLRFPNALANEAVKREVEDSILEEDNLQIRIAVSSLYLRGGDLQSEAGLKAYRTVEKYVDRATISVELRAQAREALAQLSEGQRAELRARTSEHDDANCEEALRGKAG
jgi:hypothetical protein